MAGGGWQSDCLIIGPYRITAREPYQASFWIGHESGEGMEVSKQALFDLIDKFYKDNF
jgi:hypothetical protein